MSFEALHFNHHNIFKRLSNLMYYEVKEIIYAIFENKFKSQIKYNDILTNPLDQQDYIKFLKFSFCSFIVFKIFEISNVTIAHIEELLYNKTETIGPTIQGKNPTVDKFGICISKSIYQATINEMIDANKTDYNFLANEESLNKYKNDKQNIEILNYAFNYFGLNIELGRETNKHIFISISNDAYHYRIQKTRLRDISNYANELDDIHFWLKHATPLKVGLVTNKQHNILPKILLYNPFEYTDYNKDEEYKKFENKKPNSKFATSELLRYYILNFCKNTDNTDNTTLLTHLINTNTSIKSQFIKIEDYIFEDTTQQPSILQLRSNADKFIKISKDKDYNCECGTTIDNTPYKINRHLLTKQHLDFITQKQCITIQIPDVLTCNCGGKYKNNKQSLKQHNETKQHLDFITQKQCITIKIPDVLTCICGVKYKNNKQSLKQHNETKQHLDFIKPKPIITTLDEIVCECGGKYKNTNKYLTQHNKGKKHLDFTKNKEQPQIKQQSELEKFKEQQIRNSQYDKQLQSDRTKFIIQQRIDNPTNI
jgi:hypothetical protein